MAAVCSNGLCNISATAARDAIGGLPHKRSYATLEDSHIESTWEDIPPVQNKSWRVTPAHFLGLYTRWSGVTSWVGSTGENLDSMRAGMSLARCMRNLS
jgi:hypothetical protein